MGGLIPFFAKRAGLVYLWRARPSLEHLLGQKPRRTTARHVLRWLQAIASGAFVSIFAIPPITVGLYAWACTRYLPGLSLDAAGALLLLLFGVFGLLVLVYLVAAVLMT